MDEISDSKGNKLEVKELVWYDFIYMWNIKVL